MLLISCTTRSSHDVHALTHFQLSPVCRHGIPVAAVTAMLSLPGFVVKQVVNVFQLKASMQALVAYDKRRDTENNDRRQHVD